jgi:hypothetical protein
MEDAAFKAIVTLNRVARLEPLVDRSRECELILKESIKEWAAFETSGADLAALALDMRAIEPAQAELFKLLLRHPASLLYFAETF